MEHPDDEEQMDTVVYEKQPKENVSFKHDLYDLIWITEAWKGQRTLPHSNHLSTTSRAIQQIAEGLERKGELDKHANELVYGRIS